MDRETGSLATTSSTNGVEAGALCHGRNWGRFMGALHAQPVMESSKRMEMILKTDFILPPFQTTSLNHYRQITNRILQEVFSLKSVSHINISDLDWKSIDGRTKRPFVGRVSAHQSLQLLAFLDQFLRHQRTVTDRFVTGAAAQVLVERVLDFVLRCVRFFLEQPVQFHHNAGCTKAALNRT